MKTYRGKKITEEDYNFLVQKAEGKCKICDKTPEKLVIDHEHLSGIVRGLLCSHCNSLLGFARDDVQILMSSIKYLDAFNQKKEGIPGYSSMIANQSIRKVNKIVKKQRIDKNVSKYIDPSQLDKNYALMMLRKRIITKKQCIDIFNYLGLRAYAKYL